MKTERWPLDQLVAQISLATFILQSSLGSVGGESLTVETSRTSGHPISLTWLYEAEGYVSKIIKVNYVLETKVWEWEKFYSFLEVFFQGKGGWKKQQCIYIHCKDRKIDDTEKRIQN